MTAARRVRAEAGYPRRPRFHPGAIAAELFARERRLALFGGVMLLLLLPMSIALTIDDRLLRDANVWIKPMKFALSIGAFALTTAWFVGHLPRPLRGSRSIDRIVWLLIGSASFELAYISLQAALGEASHYNVGDSWHATMYLLMGIGAVALSATQPMLAWQLLHHPDPARHPALRLAVVLGLVLSFVLGAPSGAVLSAMQPPSGVASVPWLGWSLAGGDLRPAHFVGIHAHQLLPFAGFVAVAINAARARAIVAFATLAYGAVFIALATWGLAGRA